MATTQQNTIQPNVAKAQMDRIVNIDCWISGKEQLQIHAQFLSGIWSPNRQVLWSGMTFDEAQAWAQKHGLQTLTMAMGPLMNPKSPTCLKKAKSPRSWSKYVHGASAIFAWHCSRGERVTVFTQPPPQRLNPHGPSYFQIVEEPILRKAIVEGAPLQIYIRHPAIQGAEKFEYQVYPLDMTATWLAKYGSEPRYRSYKCTWRPVGKKSRKASLDIRILGGTGHVLVQAQVSVASLSRRGKQLEEMTKPKRNKKKTKRSPEAIKRAKERKAARKLNLASKSKPLTKPKK